MKKAELLTFCQELPRGPFFQTLGWSLLASAATSGALLLLSPLVASLPTDSPSLSVTGPGSGSYLTAFVLAAALQAWLERQAHLASDRFTLQYREQQQMALYLALTRARWDLFCRERSDRFVHVAMHDCEQASQCASVFSSLISNLFLTMAYLVSAWILAPRLTLLTTALGLVLLVLLHPRRRKAQERSEKLSQHWEELHAVLTDQFQGLKLARAYNLETEHRRQFSHCCAVTSTCEQQLSRLQADGQAFAKLGTTLCIAALLAMAAWGGVQTAKLLVVSFILARVLPNLTGLEEYLQYWLSLLPATGRVRAAIAECRAMAQPELPAQTPHFEGDIVFRQVCYTYPDRTDGLQNVCLTVPRARITAIVGVSGAGKSTLLDLLLGLLEPSAGSLWVGATRLGPENWAAWRECVAYLPQDPFFFRDTLRENLLRARPDATPDELWDALTAAEAGFVRKLPLGLETPMGDRGALFSAGQRQRLGLARALLRRAPVLLLDEATSALDPDCEDKILRNLLTGDDHPTILLVTHRPASSQRAHQIVHLNTPEQSARVSAC